MSRISRQASESAHRRQTSRRCVLVAIGPDGGIAALRTARSMAVREVRPLVVLSVVEPPAVYAFDPAPVMAMPWRIDEQLDVRRASVRDRLTHLGPLAYDEEEPTVVVTFGEPERVIAETARERQAHVIVMGSGPHALANRVLATETTLRTIRRAPCPVLAVRDTACEEPRTVVVALDFSPPSLHAARQALTLLPDGAVVHLVHVWRRHVPPFPAVRPDPLDDEYERAIPGRFDRARQLLGRERSLVFVNSAVTGDPVAALLEHARRLRAELLVAGAQGHNLAERLLVGSVSTALLRGAPCPILVSPEPPAAERARIERHMTGTSRLRKPEEWAEELAAFSRRNQARLTALEIDDMSIGAQVQESGYALLGASYDRRDNQVSLMFADPSRPEAHLTRTMGHVRSVAVSAGLGGGDGALCIESDQGSTVLTFIDRAGR